MKQIWDTEELSKYWSLSYEELQLLKTKLYNSHLAFCMQLKYYQYYGVFTKSKYPFTIYFGTARSRE